MKWLSLKKHSQSEMSWEKAVNAQPSIVLTPYVTRPLVLSLQVVFWMYSGYEQPSPPSNEYNMLLERKQEKVNQFNPFRTARRAKYSHKGWSLEFDNHIALRTILINYKRDITSDEIEIQHYPKIKLKVKKSTVWNPCCFSLVNFMPVCTLKYHSIILLDHLNISTGNSA